MGGILEAASHPLSCLLCSRIDIRVFGPGGDVNVMLWATVRGRLSSSAMCKDLCFTGTLKAGKAGMLNPIFRCANSGSDKLRYRNLLSRAEEEEQEVLMLHPGEGGVWPHLTAAHSLLFCAVFLTWHLSESCLEPPSSRFV